MPTAAQHIARRLAAGPPLLVDGAMGTELERRGIASSLPLWSARGLLEAPDVVARIHTEYVAAGAEILTANTFRTQRRTLALAGLTPAAERARELTALAVALARSASSPSVSPSPSSMCDVSESSDASGSEAAPSVSPSSLGDASKSSDASGSEAAPRAVFVAGSAPPLEDCYRPERVPDADALRREHAEHAENLAHAGVDLILVETMNTVREAVAAAGAACATGLPFFSSFVTDGGAHLLSGEPLAAAIDAVGQYGPACVLVNCIPPRAVGPCLRALAAGGAPFGVYANLGEPTAGGARTDDCSPVELGRRASEWVIAGARAVGGCCGTTPAHLAAVAARLAR